MDLDTIEKIEGDKSYIGGIRICHYKSKGIDGNKKSKPLSSRLEMVAQRMIEAIPNKPLRLMVPNLSKEPIHLPKQIYVGVGVHVLKRIVSFSGKLEESVNSIPHYK